LGFKNYIENHKLIHRFLIFAKSFSLPGFKRVSIFNVASFFIQETGKDSINIRASSIAFNLCLALFPLIIFLFTLLPYIPIEGFQTQLMEFFHGNLPDYIFKTIEDTINDLISIPRSGLLSVGFILALYFASNGVASLIESFEKDNLGYKNTSFIFKRFKAIYITIILTMVLFITVVLLIGSQYLLTNFNEYLSNNYLFLKYLVITIRGIIFFFLIFNSIAIIYLFAPSLDERWEYFSPGAIFTSVLIFLFTYVFTFYINNFNSYNRIYGSIGAIMAVMIFIYIIALFIIIGFELNNSIEINKNLKNQLPPL